jgi:hypothetical protein
MPNLDTQIAQPWQEDAKNVLPWSLEVEDEVPHVLMVDANLVGAHALGGELARTLGPLKIAHLLPEEDQELPAGPFDVCVAHISDAAPSVLALVTSFAVKFSDAALVYWSDEPYAAQVSAALALGVSQIIPGAALSGWLARALPALVRGARSRRSARLASQSLPPVPAWSWEDTSAQRMPLPLAENLFREAYIRRVLAETGNRRKAAEVAGIPYRTFCDILKKLGIA